MSTQGPDGGAIGGGFFFCVGELVLEGSNTVLRLTKGLGMEDVGQSVSAYYRVVLGGDMGEQADGGVNMRPKSHLIVGDGGVCPVGDVALQFLGE